MEPTPADHSQAPSSSHRSKRPRRTSEKVVRHYKVDHHLSAEDRAAYDAKLLDPRQTVNSLHAWLKEKGYGHISRTAVHRHRRRFALDVKGIRHDAAAASHFATIARAQGGAALAEAGQFRFEQMFLEQLFRMKKSDSRTGKEWIEMGKALETLLNNRRDVDAQREEWERRARAAAEAVARDARDRGDDEAEAAARVSRILGLEVAGGKPDPVDDPTGGAALARRVDRMFGIERG